MPTKLVLKFYQLAQILLMLLCFEKIELVIHLLGDLFAKQFDPV